VIDLDLRCSGAVGRTASSAACRYYYADPAIPASDLARLARHDDRMRRFSVSRFWEVVMKFDATEILSIASVPALLMKGEPGPSERDHRISGLAIHAGLPKELHAQMIDRYGFSLATTNMAAAAEGGIMSRVPQPSCRRAGGLGHHGRRTAGRDHPDRRRE
jgi:crotonobetaine/carnitine-CoA ligase